MAKSKKPKEPEQPASEQERKRQWLKKVANILRKKKKSK